jgi:2-polyprenyl-3-methyl-5-hydroxy-6-metoxy-1,4-benzoquinol methylase
MTETLVCEACGGPTKTWAVKNAYRIVRCLQCGHGFVGDKPTPDTLDQLYVHMDPRFVHAEREAEYWADMPIWQEPRDVYRALTRLGSPRGRLLDVGAGRGRFTEYFSKRGYDCLAVEPNPYFAREIEARCGARVLQGSLDDMQADVAATGEFDVILMAEVIEHLVAPADSMRRCRSLLREGGVLVLIMPNFNSILIKGLGAREGHVCPPMHLNFFTRKSLDAFARRTGYRVMATRTASNLTLRSTTAGIVRYTGAPRLLASAAALTGTVALRCADRAGMGRYLYGYLGRD